MKRPIVRTTPAEKAPHAIVHRWLVSLRWVAFALLACTLPVGEQLFGFHVQYQIALPAVAVAALFNLAANSFITKASGRAGPRLVAAFVAFDLVAIGVVLAASGGAANPFSALFLVHVALAAAVLPATLTFALSVLAAAVFAGLFLVPAGSCCAAHARDGSFSAHLYGMWMAFVLCAGLVAFFVTRIRQALEAREQEILRLRRSAEHAARFASLGTLAAGTAHELGTPLGTIAVLAGEISEGDLSADETQSHAQAIRAAVSRCRDVVTRMQTAAHASRAAVDPLNLVDSTHDLLAEWQTAHPNTRLQVHLTDTPVWAPIAADEYSQVLSVVLDNANFATQAAATTAPLVIQLRAEDGRATITVEDRGTGVAEHLLEKLGEPFLTTKEPGQGMGLGLYLARGLLEPVGGTLRVENLPNGGARATINLPTTSQPVSSTLPAFANAAE
ncbi:MAG: HAMP domain-containing histidine kinase [Polyangiaceae bacterium]|nr:HAMP domain-containing histidine kinase [Polyangiaceae bacterium]